MSPAIVPMRLAARIAILSKTVPVLCWASGPKSMNGKTRVTSINPYRIAASTRIGYVNLRVRDLERSLAFYLDVLGFRMVSGSGHTATLSATGRGPGLIVLTARKDAPARPARATGLYHFAIRVPNRRALAMVIRRLEEMQWPVQG